VGVLSFDDIAAQRRAIKELLTQVHAVVLDVADLRVQHGPAVQVLPPRFWPRAGGHLRGSSSYGPMEGWRPHSRQPVSREMST